MPAFHAPEEMLLAYASGSLSEPLSLVVASHISLDDTSREAVADFEEVGGALIEEIEPVALSSDALESILDKLDDLEAESSPSAPVGRDGLDLPPALRVYVGEDIEALKWRSLLRGVQEAEIPASDGEGSKARLLRIAPGRAVPQHSHRGFEVTLVLEGAYRDGEEVYGRGDMQVAGDTVDHRPVVEGDVPCLCLVVNNAPIRLTGPLGRLIDPFIRY